MRNLALWTLALTVTALGCGNDSGTAGKTLGPKPSPADAMVAAIGGQSNLDAIKGLLLVGSGERFVLNEGARPADKPINANTFQRTVSIDLGADALRVDTSREILFQTPGPQVYSDIIQGNLGVSTQPFFGRPLGALASDKAASIRRQEVLITPHLLLRELTPAAFVAGQDVTLGGVIHHTLVASGGTAPLTLFVDASSGLITRLETLELDFLERDVSIEVLFSDWAPAGTTSFPRSARVLVGGREVFKQRITDVTINPKFEASTFKFPEGLTPVFDAALHARGELSHQWYALTDSIGLPVSGVDLAVTPVDIAPNVVKLVGTTHHSFVVKQESGLILVDAALYEDRADALLKRLEAQYPGVPVTHVVASHFHQDHAAGIRQVLGRTGASLVVQESVAEFWRQLLAAPSTMRHDALADSPRDVKVITVPQGGELTLEDPRNPVTLYHVRTPHAADMLLTRDVASNSMFVVDIYSPGNAVQPGAAELDAAITSYGIPTADLKIVGAHGAGMDNYAALMAFLAPR